MKETISDTALVSYLEEIRQEIHNLDCLDNGQVVFMNLESFFAYMNTVNQMQNGKESRLREILDQIELFIPINVSEQYIELFMAATRATDRVVTEDISCFLDKMIKINFINQIYQARVPEAWANIVRLCRAARELYEEGTESNAFDSPYFSPIF